MWRFREGRVDDERIGLPIPGQVVGEPLEQGDFKGGHRRPHRRIWIEDLDAPLEIGSDPDGFHDQPVLARLDVPSIPPVPKTEDGQPCPEIEAPIPVDVNSVAERLSVPIEESRSPVKEPSVHVS